MPGKRKIERIPQYRMEKGGVSFVFKEKIEKQYDPDFERVMETPSIDVTAVDKGKKYGFIVRNIPDVGLAINPKAGTATASGSKCGLPMDVESFMKQNELLAYSTERKLSRQEQETIFRKEHPSGTGYGWDRAFCKGKKWIPMTENEVRVYKTLLKALPDYMHDVRTQEKVNSPQMLIVTSPHNSMVHGYIIVTWEKPKKRKFKKKHTVNSP